MKKQLLILISVFFLITAALTTGCKKHTCTCVASNSNNPEPSGKSEFNVSGTKRKAANKCEDYSTPEDSFGNKTTCYLK